LGGAAFGREAVRFFAAARFFATGRFAPLPFFADFAVRFFATPAS
jgi:hypothetical protein